MNTARKSNRSSQKASRGTKARKVSDNSTKSSKKRSAGHKAVAKTVRAPEMPTRVPDQLEHLYGLVHLAIDNLHLKLAKSRGGWLALDVLCCLGVIPDETGIHEPELTVQAPEEPKTEEVKVKAEILELVNVAYERAKIFGGPAPSVSNLAEAKNKDGIGGLDKD